MPILRAQSARARNGASAVLALVLLAAALSIAAPAESAPVVNHDRVVSAVPGQTPAVNDGEVDAIVQVGNVVVVGGTFTNVTPVGEAATTRNYIFAFNVSDGKLVAGFNPVFNGSVNELIPGPTTGSVYVGGGFTNVNGTAASHVTHLSLATGAVMPGFRAAATNGVVNAMVKQGGRLILGGNFATAGGVAHNGLASLNGTTGALDPYITSRVSVHHNDSGQGAQGAVGVRDLDITPDGTRVVAVGNFKRVDTLVRDQVVMLSLGATQTITPDWNTNRYSPYCFRFAFDTYMRGVSFSPDGSYFVATSTGGYNAGTLCDTAARFETRAVGTDVQPTWVDYTGGDTLWAVTVTERAVYIGGHQRWLNNSLASDRAGAGAVPRPGLAALNVNTGVPLKWNPGRNPRGAAVYALHATPQGLWLGSDTEWIGNHRYRRPRIAFFPLVSGSPEASDATAGLPGNAYLGGDQFPATATTDDLRTVPLSTTGATAGTTVADGGVDWSSVRGSFVAGGKLWYGKTVNNVSTFNSRTFTNGAFGPEVVVDPYNDPEWAGVDTGSNNTFDGAPTSLYSQLSTVNGMAYAGGKLYYVRNNDNNLYWRWFNADSGIIGADQFVAANTGRTWGTTMGMFATGGKLYFVTRLDGNLNSMTLSPTGPTGASAVVNGPLTLGGNANDWRTRALFLVGQDQPPLNQPPTAAFTSSCTALVCNFNGGGSGDSDGTINNYAWDFGDLTPPANGPTATTSHTYSGPGTYLVTLTVTDDDGATATTNAQVIVTATQATPVSFVASTTKSANVAAPTVMVPVGVAAGDTLVMTGSLSNATSASAPAGWRVAGETTATATLRSVVWVRTVAAPSEAGTSVAVTMDTVHKATLTMNAYRGVNAAGVTASPVSDANTTSHRTPDVTPAVNGSWVVSFWADKGANTQWTVPPNTVSLRAQAYSSASGAVSSAVADSNGPRTGPVAGTTATSNQTSVRGINWSIVLPPQ